MHNNLHYQVKSRLTSFHYIRSVIFYVGWFEVAYTFILRRLVFDIQVTVKWGNTLFSSVIYFTTINCIVMCTQETAYSRA
jgi:hypothetical protein